MMALLRAWMRRLVGLALLFLLAAVFGCTSNSPPGKPVLKKCQSPEKETFTCWWEPGHDDGENTTYRLFYEKDQPKGTFECPDYHTAGKNSCFFPKNHTSIWVDYFITVVAFNAFGNTTSDLVKIDVMDIVKPNTPENVTLQLDISEEIPTVHVRWESPHNTRFKSGWITLKYQLRVKHEDSEWNMHTAGTQTHFSLYSVLPGKMYMVQVRCALDHGSWSEWSNTTYIKVPKSDPEQHTFWILVSFLSAMPFLAAMCTLFIKRKFIKQWLLPPVPGPKIKGVDVQLLKNGQCEEVSSALILNNGFPPMVPWENQVEEYMIVCDDNQSLLLVEDRKSIKSIISHNFHLEVNIYNKESKSEENTLEIKEEEELMGYLIDASKSGSMDRSNNVNTTEIEEPPSNQKDNVLNAIKPVENSSTYVAIQRHEEDILEGDMRQMDYSTVKEVKGDNLLILEKQNNVSVSKYMDIKRHDEEDTLPEDYSKVKEVNNDNVVLLQDSSCGNKGIHYTDFGNQKPSNSQVTVDMGVYTEFLDNGYVDNINATPTM